MKILVTGGSGMLGKHLQELYPDAIFISSKKYDLTRESEVESMYNYYSPDIVIHAAAKVGGIIDNINKPAEYFEDNILMNTLLLKYAYKFKTKRFIAILSTCIYPDVNFRYPMLEEDMFLGPPTTTNFSYGYAKRAMAVQIDSYNKQYGTSYNYLIPCNLYSEYDNFYNEEKSHFITSLLKKIKLAVENNQTEIELYGTGKPLRQFMYAQDLAKIIKLSIDNNIIDNFNVANEENLSIEQMALLAIESLGLNLKIVYKPNTPDGQYRKDVSIEKLKTYFPHFNFISLKEGIQKIYNQL
jgi:GDP-L-fucose synthase